MDGPSIETSINFLDAIEKIGNPGNKEWRRRTANQKQRFQAMHVITHEEFAEYKKYVEDFQSCKCGSHVALGEPENVMVYSMVAGFWDDIRVAEELGIEIDAPYGFSPGEQPMFADFDEMLAKDGNADSNANDNDGNADDEGNDEGNAEPMSDLAATALALQYMMIRSCQPMLKYSN